jgi:hypothetical protein
MKCSKNGCNFIKHHDEGNNGGTHCCLACKIGNSHGLLCQSSSTVPESIVDLLKVYDFTNKIRLGIKGDGGYVIGDINTEYDCYISAGVSNEESFTRDFINKYTMAEHNSFAFDGTINSYPYNYTTNISFIKKNINSYTNDTNTNLAFLCAKYQNIFLKMDVEGGEWPWLLSMTTSMLNNFKQIVLEVHGLSGDGWYCPYNDKIRCLKNLNQTHYLIHAHGNNYSPVFNSIPDVMELTFINKKCLSEAPALNRKALPIANLDFPNSTDLADINLNFFPFVTS